MQKFTCTFALAAALIAGASSVRAQTLTTVPSTITFEPTTYTNQQALTQGYSIVTGATTPSGAGQGGWLTTDPENDNLGGTTEYVGGSDFVLQRTTTVTYGSGTQFALLGGYARNQYGATPLVPGSATPTDYHQLPTLSPGTGQGYQIDGDFAVTVASGATAQTDTFALTLGVGTGGSAAPLVTIYFAPSTITPFSTDLGYAVGTTSVGSDNKSGSGSTLNAQFHLTIQVNSTAKTFSAYYTQGTGTTQVFIAKNISLGAGSTPNAVNQIAAIWTLKNGTVDANGGYSGASGDSMVFDNLAVSYFTPVPEPSTYAACGFGLLALLAAHKRRRHVC